MEFHPIFLTRQCRLEVKISVVKFHELF